MRYKNYFLLCIVLSLLVSISINAQSTGDATGSVTAAPTDTTDSGASASGSGATGTGTSTTTDSTTASSTIGATSGSTTTSADSGTASTTTSATGTTSGSTTDSGAASTTTSTTGTTSGSTTDSGTASTTTSATGTTSGLTTDSTSSSTTGTTSGSTADSGTASTTTSPTGATSTTDSGASTSTGTTSGSTTDSGAASTTTSSTGATSTTDSGASTTGTSTTSGSTTGGSTTGGDQPVDTLTLFELVQPVCSFGVGKLVSKQPNAKFFINNTEIVATSNLSPGLYEMTVTYDQPLTLNQTDIIINYGEFQKSTPQYTVKQETCGKKDGSITIGSPELYSFISLNGDPLGYGDPVFDGLSAGTYLLTLVSVGCATQVVQIELVSVSPKMTLTLVPSACAANSTVSVSLPADYVDPVFKVNNQDLVGNNFTLSSYIGADIVVSYTANGCSSSETLSLQSLETAYPIIIKQSPITSSINNTVFCVQQFANVNVSSSYPDIQVFNSNNEQVSLTGNSFTAAYGASFTVKSAKCSLAANSVVGQYQVAVPSPVITISNTTNVCQPNSLTVENYADFYNLTLTINNNGTITYMTPLNGLFSDIPSYSNMSVTLNYTYGDSNRCNDSYAVSSVSVPVAFSFDPDYSQSIQSNITAAPSACANGTVVFSLDLNSFPIFDNLTYTFSPNETIFVQFKSSSGCEIHGWWTAPSTSVPAPAAASPVATVVSPNTCDYQLDSIVQFSDSVYNISKVFIDGVEQSNVSLAKGLTTGSHTVVFQYAELCVPQVALNVTVLSTSNYKLAYTLDPVSCGQTGTPTLVMISDISNLLNITVDSVAYDPLISGWSVESGAHTFDFSSDVCNGSLSFNTQPEYVITYQVTPASCDQSTDAVITFTAALVSSQTQVSITSVKFNEQESQGNSITGVPTGNQTFTIVVNDCQVQSIVTIPSIQNPFTFNVTNATGCDNTDGRVDVVAASGVTISAVQSSSGHINSATILQLAGNQSVNLNITYNNVCTVSQVVFVAQVATVPVPTFNFTSPSCKLADGSLVLANYTDYTNVYLSASSTANPIEMSATGSFGQSFIYNTTYLFSATHIPTGCKLKSIPISIPIFESASAISNQSSFLTANETCLGTANGAITMQSVGGSSLYSRLYNNANQFVGSQTNDSSISSLLSGIYQAKLSLVDNPFCVGQVPVSLQLSSQYNPTLSYTSYGTCSPNSEGALVPSVSYPSNSINFSLTGNTTSFDMSHLAAGQYMLSAEITDPICRRKFAPVAVVIEKNDGIFEAVLDTTICASLLLTVNGGNRGNNTPLTLYNITITNAADSMDVNQYQLNATVNNSINITNLEYGKTYNVLIESNFQCSIHTDIVLQQCIEPKPKSDKLSGGALAGIIVAVTIVVSILGLVAYFLIKKSMMTKYHHPVEMDSPQYKLMMDERE